MSERSLTERLLDDADSSALDPFALFEDWLAAARETEPNDPTAMALATVDAGGLPDARMVLLNQRDRRGFVFFTNFGSAKGQQLQADPKAALLFHWKTQRRQIRIRGPVEVVSDAEADAYFHSRPRGSQIASSASEQSRPLTSKAEIQGRVRELETRYEGAEVPRPPHWSGFRVVPAVFEFWQDGQFRLHDRFQFTPAGEGWRYRRLNP